MKNSSLFMLTGGYDYITLSCILQGITTMSADISSFIVCTPGVVGGRPRINGTRISVRTIAVWYKQGYSPEEIADQYEDLTLAQVYAALTYYHANQAEIEADIAAEDAEYERLVGEHRQTQKSA